MNINAGNPSLYNLLNRNQKEEKRPSFESVFEKLNKRTSKLSSRNALNSVLTNEQMYRYYLTDTEPLLTQSNDDFNLDDDDDFGGKSLEEMKVKDFLKILTNKLDNSGGKGDIIETPAQTFATTFPLPFVPIAPPTPPPTPPPPLSGGGPAVAPLPTPAGGGATPPPPPVASAGGGATPPPPPVASAGGPTLPTTAGGGAGPLSTLPPLPPTPLSPTFAGGIGGPVASGTPPPLATPAGAWGAGPPPTLPLLSPTSAGGGAGPVASGTPPPSPLSPTSALLAFAAGGGAGPVASLPILPTSAVVFNPSVPTSPTTNQMLQLAIAGGLDIEAGGGVIQPNLPDLTKKPEMPERPTSKPSYNENTQQGKEWISWAVRTDNWLKEQLENGNQVGSPLSKGAKDAVKKWRARKELQSSP